MITRVPGLAEPQQFQLFATRQWQQADALHIRRHLGADQIQDGRHHVDDANLVRHGAGRHARPGYDQRNAHRRVVDEEAVLLLAVLAERLAVVGDDDHKRVVETPTLLQPIEEPANLRIGGGNLGVVGALHGGGKARPIRLGRRVGAVGIVQMHPRQKRTVAVFGEPRQRVIDHLAAGPLSGVEAGGHFVIRQVERVEVMVEPLRDAPSVIEHEGADKSPGAIAAGLQHLGERGDGVVHVEAAVVAHTVKGREGAGEERGVGRQRQRRYRRRLLEPQAACGQGIKDWSGGSLVAVATQPVGAQRIDADEEHRPRAAARCAAEPALLPSDRADGETGHDGQHCKNPAHAVWYQRRCRRHRR